MKTFLPLLLTLLASEVWAVEEDGFVALFNGQDLRVAGARMGSTLHCQLAPPALKAYFGLKASLVTRSSCSIAVARNQLQDRNRPLRGSVFRLEMGKERNCDWLA